MKNENEKIIPYTEVPSSMIMADFLSSNEFRVVSILHSYAFKQRIFPSQAELAMKSSCTDRTIRNCVQTLEEKGIISSIKRDGKAGRFTTNEYSFACRGWNAWFDLHKGVFSHHKAETGAVVAEELAAADGVSVSENPLNYVRIFNDFLYSDKLSANQLRVFLYLKQFSRCKTIYPTYETMQEKLGLSKHTVVKTINELGDLGLVRKIITMRKEGGYTSNEYLIANDEELLAWLGLSK